ncbi:nuclear receptor-interacting protein 1 [Sebastes umbrosus]|uniref:nuclear receptor-interacting protein 1 n=1 Tax=Sebastes umbrosus TaxID=72105 RepID=UPI00189CA183|nr:nuclear receptor-interacting protein 1 [Sebastes umbrosus]XP_037605263.1 nuclear receptor-interacting protein 1 [Sebastes umbrosus]
MTHGEEPGPETHKDSAVLTYLEGLLMHPVVAGPGATASGRSEAAHSNQEQGDKAGGPFQRPNHGPTAPKAGTNGPTLGSSQHLKKARLLRSGAWNDPGTQRMSSPPMELNGQGGGLQNGALEGSPHAGESTLLASLLQSFSSRLQSVAMSQHSNKPPSECSSPSKAPPADKEPLPVYGTASSRLKGLMRKSKLQNHSNTPYSRRGHSQDRPPESPRSAHSATPPSVAPATAEAVSCAERLKAVANMVKIRSSPAPSPKPSVACSQLALLLSSEAHLQQYSREHALKAQLSGRSASERLAAMASQQYGPDTRPPSVGGALPGAPDTLSSLTTQNGMTTTPTLTTTLPRTALSSPQSPSLLRGHGQISPPTPPHAPNPSHSQPPPPPREKRGFDSRPTRPPQTCSSLLLLLLNNHNNQKQLTKNGHLEDSCGVLPPSGSSSVTSDSECSVQERSLTKDSSDAESSYSSCSPIDLSMRGRASTQDTGPKTTTPSSSFSSFSSSTSTLSSSTTMFSSTPAAAFSPQASAHPSISFSPSSTAVSSVSTAISSSSSSSLSTSSLDKLTESLLNKWKPEPSGSKVCKNKEPDMSPDLKPHSKVTLMQLLLERRNNEMVNKSVVNQESPLDITMATMSRGQPKGLVPWEESRTNSPTDRPCAPAQPLYSLSREPGGALSPYSYPSPNIQSSPLDLCKSKPFPAEKASEPAFSASKLLQNLAQCGTASSSPPIPPSKGLGLELDASRPLALLERLNAPIHRTSTTPLSDGPSGSGTPFSQKDASPQIENLLEKRTVLQLLLGTGSTTATVGRKERPGGGGSGRRSAEVAGGCYEKSPGASIICDSSNGPPLDVKVKTEFMEEAVGPSSAVSEEPSVRKRPAGYEKNSPLSDSQQDLKTEPRPAEVIAKYGLLSQLLKQQTATYYTSSALQAEPQPRQVKEEHRDYASPGPKKRRLCSDRTDAFNHTGSPRGGDGGGGGGDMNFYAPSAVQEEPEQRRSVKEEEAPPPSEPLTRESRGFNVLKQLLLSDNCLKELSQQPRGTPSPSVLQANGKANGSMLSQPAHNHSFLHLPGWHPHGSLNSGLPGNLRPPPAPPACESPVRNPWSRHPAPWPVAPKRDPPTLVKQEPESPLRWSSQENEEEEEGCDSNLDSPRLSRSNPILYYMLQKGSIQLRKEVRDQAEGTHSAVRVKEEPLGDMHAYEHSLSSVPPSPAHNDKHSHESHGLSQSYE